MIDGQLYYSPVVTFAEQAVFFLHLSVEKALKAAICERSGVEGVPRTHHLQELARQAGLSPSERALSFLVRLNPHSVGARYDSANPSRVVAYTVAMHERFLPEATETLAWVRQQVE